jgi:aryl-alcohol dehydrogenase-like predicted oxidoreductase
MTQLGRTGVSVSRLCLGTGGFGKPADRQAQIRLVHAALDAGVNFVDTADTYGQGTSEELLGAALAGRRDDVVISTKFYGPMGSGPNRGGASRRWIMRAVEGSLRRLDTDHLDLYLQHRPDFDVDLDEPLGALTDLVHQGKIRYFGASRFPAEMVVEAEWRSDVGGHLRLTSNEVTYSITVRGVETSVVPTCRRLGIAVMAFSPLDSGWLGGRHTRADGIRRDGHWAGIVPQRFDPTVPENVRKLAIVDELTTLAAEAGLPLPQLAVAWALEHPAVTSVIVGARDADQLAGLLPAVGIRLDADVLDRIDRLVTPGTTVNPVDDNWTPPSYSPGEDTVYPRLPALLPAARRRPAGAA